MIESEMSDAEVVALVKENLAFLKKENNVSNFFVDLKKLGFSALKHLSFIAPFLNKKSQQYQEEAVRVGVQLELADMLFRAGATVKEVAMQTNIDDALLATLLRTYYKELPASVLQYKLMQFRLYELILQNKAFLENYVFKDLKNGGKELSQGVLSSLQDMLLSNVEDRMFLDNVANARNNEIDG